ncbi:vascular-related unknown protein 1-like isoform X2 [Papaver somniferum]|uniref:vascular-related unknown protein 1-like isoform X2 n=1 Tax=Papaver somniferum TaxID=3469 RepID=UPI000E6FDB86|nr:vascular-related unknown protein 1-like isoform X2 [Papaver somniferum]
MEGSDGENMQAEEQQNSFVSQDHPEESGWTFYLDDDEFFPRNSIENRVQPSSSSCYDDTPSMISDADSLAPWKFMDSTTSKKLGLLNPKKNKKKINSGTNDPDMEDTASSPVNSPKVSSMKQYHRQTNSPRQNQDNDDDDDHIDNEYSTSQQRRKGSMSGDHQHFSALQLHEDRNNRMDFVEMRSSPNNNSNPRQFTDLKEKGLCVVPLSMFVNYLK